MKLIEKIKSIKNIELYLALGLAVIVLVVIFATSAINKSPNLQTEANYNEYITAMENKISSVIEKMDGCGNVRVAISYSSENEKEYAYETVVTTNGTTVKETNSIVKVNGEPLVVKTLAPTVTGVVVVADGAHDAAVKVKIKQVVVTLLGVSMDKVQVFTYKS